MSIPIAIRRALAFDKTKKALVRVVNNSIIIEPVEDLLDLGGVLHEKALRGKSLREIRLMEKEGAAEGFSRGIK